MAPPQKKAKIDTKLVQEESLSKFKSWMKQNGITLSSKATIDCEKCCSNYGIVALENISEGEEVARIPRKMTLDHTTSPLKASLTKDKVLTNAKGNWAALVLSLAAECQNENSTWKPYLELFYHPTEFKMPMFWPKEEMEKELGSTGVLELLERDTINMDLDYEHVITPFVKEHKGQFKREISQDEFKRLVAFIMSYSFTENAEDKKKEHYPLMVPFADMFNHGSDAHVKLEYHKEYLAITAVCNIEKDNEIFNSYGELSNAQLLHTYGFAYPADENEHDAVDIPAIFLLKGFQSFANKEEKESMEEKKQFLEEVDMLNEESPYYVSMYGIQNDEELYYSLKILYMNATEFKEYRYKEVIEEEDEEDDPSVELAFENIKKLPDKWRRTLVEMCKYRMDEFEDKGGFEEHEELFHKGTDHLSDRQLLSAFVRHGQLTILQNFIDVLKGEDSEDALSDEEEELEEGEGEEEEEEDEEEDEEGVEEAEEGEEEESE